MLLVMTIGGVIVLSILCRKRRSRAGPRKAIRTAVKTTSYARNQTCKAPQVDMEKQRLRICRDYNRRIKAELERNQARDDITHLEQRKADLLKAYEQIPDNDNERTIKRRIAYDNAIRNTDKQIEKAYMILHRTY